MTAEEPYYKAAGSDRMVSHYDLVARLGMREGHIKRRVIALAQVSAGRRMLDLGCGTGTLVLIARRLHPGATVIGVDGDPTILDIARRKAQRERIRVQLDEAMAYALPYADGSFDAVVSTLMLHHLTPDQQERTLAEVRRVLGPRGRFVIADVAPPHNLLMRLLQRFPVRGGHRHGGQDGPRFHPRHLTRLEELLRTQRWQPAAPTEYFMSIMGTITLTTLARPDGNPE